MRRRESAQVARARRSDPWACARFARGVPLEPVVVGSTSVAVVTQRAILLLLASYADCDGRYANPSVATIAGELGLDERTARRGLRALEQQGALRTRAGDSRGQRSNSYTLCLDRWQLHVVPDAGDVDEPVAEEVTTAPATGASGPQPGGLRPPDLPCTEELPPLPPRDHVPAAPDERPEPVISLPREGPAAVTGRPARRQGCPRHPRAVAGCPACGNRDGRKGHVEPRRAGVDVRRWVERGRAELERRYDPQPDG